MCTFCFKIELSEHNYLNKIVARIMTLQSEEMEVEWMEE